MRSAHRGRQRFAGDEWRRRSEGPRDDADDADGAETTGTVSEALSTCHGFLGYQGKLYYFGAAGIGGYSVCYVTNRIVTAYSIYNSTTPATTSSCVSHTRKIRTACTSGDIRP